MSIDAEIAAQFAAMGVAVPPSETPVTRQEFAVFPQNWTSLLAWLACETQWQALAGLGGLTWLGLNYAGVDVVLRRRGWDHVFEQLQLMEIEALRTFSEAAR